MAEIHPTEGSNNPAELNIPVITNGFDQLVRQCNQYPSDAFFQVATPVELTLRNGKLLQATLNYRSKAAQTAGKYPVEVGLSIVQNGESLSHRTWFSDVRRANKQFDIVDISSDSGTKSGWEGNGFGIALMATTDTAISHFIRHFTRWNANLPVFAHITNRSHGWILGRPNWSEKLAQEIGYTKVSGDRFEKQYR